MLRLFILCQQRYKQAVPGFLPTPWILSYALVNDALELAILLILRYEIEVLVR
jgi:hypothetical protein